MIIIFLIFVCLAIGLYLFAYACMVYGFLKKRRQEKLQAQALDEELERRERAKAVNLGL